MKYNEKSKTYKCVNEKEVNNYYYLHSFILSFFNTRKSKKNLLINLLYLKESKDDNSIDLFRKEMNSYIYLFFLKYKNLNYLYEEYKCNKETSFIYCALYNIYKEFIRLCKEENIIK